MELIKKISVESIKHLSKHVNLVTDFDEETGEVIHLCIRENKVKSFFEHYPDAKIKIMGQLLITFLKL